MLVEGLLDGVQGPALGKALDGRYRRAVGAWNVVSGLHAGAAFALSFEQIIELTRMLIAQVKTILPNAKTLVSITHPFGEYHAKAGVASAIMTTTPVLVLPVAAWRGERVGIAGLLGALLAMAGVGILLT